MLLHKNHKLIYNNCVAIEIPNDVFVDSCPDACPREGLVLHTQDGSTTIDFDFLGGRKDARCYLEEAAEDFKIIKKSCPISAGGLNGFYMMYESRVAIYEEYVFEVFGAEPVLLDICFEMKKTCNSSEFLYVKVRDEMIAGITALF